jgi:hypothetical protein
MSGFNVGRDKMGVQTDGPLQHGQLPTLSTLSMRCVVFVDGVNLRKPKYLRGEYHLNGGVVVQERI